MALGILLVNAHVVVQQAMHADVAETDLLLHQGQLCLPVGAQSFIGAARADALLPHRTVRSANLREVHGDYAILRAE